MRVRMPAVLLALALVAPAHAWAAPSSPHPGRCRLLDDPAGDVSFDRGHVDLRYVDLGITKTHLTVTFGVTDVGDPVENGRWRMYFSVGKEQYTVTAYRDLSMLRFSVSGDYRMVTGTIDDGLHEVRVVIPLKAFRKPPRKGDVLTDIIAFTAETYGDGWFVNQSVASDDAWLWDQRHVLGRTGC